MSCLLESAAWPELRRGGFSAVNPYCESAGVKFCLFSVVFSRIMFIFCSLKRWTQRAVVDFFLNIRLMSLCLVVDPRMFMVGLLKVYTM